MFPISEYFRILVVGHACQPIADLVEAKLDFRTTLCSSEETASVVHDDADIAAIVIGRADVAAAVKARSERDFATPIFLLSRREDDNVEEPYLKDLGDVFTADLERRKFYRRRLLTRVGKYVGCLMAPFSGALMRCGVDPEGPPRAPRQYLRHMSVLNSI
jgi:hypothetical protein